MVTLRLIDLAGSFEEMATLSSPLDGSRVPAFSMSGISPDAESEDAICRFYRLYSREIAAFVRKYARNEEDVSDLVQDVYCKALVHLRKAGDPIQNPRAWLYQIARFHCIDKVVKRNDHDAELQQTFYARKTTYEFEEGLLNSALIDDVLNFVEAEFSADEKNIFELKILQSMSLAEVAEIMDVHASTITRILQRLCNKIAERFV
jgi:RNA polymerase sigma factor (sigma-70 family)